MTRGEGATLDDLRDSGDASTWLNLNGLWEWEAVPCGVPRTNCPGMNPPLLCCPDGNSSTVPPFGKTLEKSILVPFPQESCLSGVAPRTSDDVAMRSWYRLTFDAQPTAVGRRFLLHFGAVDHQAMVYVNKELVANHSGGYDSFSADITAALALNEDAAAPHEMLVYAFDPSETGPQLGGKQRMGVLSNPGELWTIVYTSTTVRLAAICLNVLSSQSVSYTSLLRMTMVIPSPDIIGDMANRLDRICSDRAHRRRSDRASKPGHGGSDGRDFSSAGDFSACKHYHSHGAGPRS